MVKAKETAPKELVIKKFLGKINPSGFRTNRKAALGDLETVLIKNEMELNEENLVTMLLAGCKYYPKGLLRICGEHSVSNLVSPDLTRAAILAVRLLAKLLDPAIYKGATFMQECLKKLPAHCLSYPNFAHHLIRDNSVDAAGVSVFDPPMRVISVFLRCVPNVQLSDFIHDDWARYFYLRQAVGNYTQFEDTFWGAVVVTFNFSHSMVTEFLTTSKHRMPRDVWLRNINTYFVKCKPTLRKDTIDILMEGLPKKKGLLRMCSNKKNYSQVAKDLLAQLVDEHCFPDAGRIADFLLERRDLVAMLNYSPFFDAVQASPADTKIHSVLSNRAKIGEVKEVLLLLHDEETEPIPVDGTIPLLQRDTSLESLKKACGRIHGKSVSSSNISWDGDYSSVGSFPSMLSFLDDFQSPITSPQSTHHHHHQQTPYSPPSPPRPRSPITPDAHMSPQNSFSSSPISSTRTSEEFMDGSISMFPLDRSLERGFQSTPVASASASTSVSDSVSPSMRIRIGKRDSGGGAAPEVVIAALEQFFQEHSLLFSRLEYRRLLIFLMSVVVSKFNSVESIFAELGLESNPQYETSASHLFERLDGLGANFTDELCTMWAQCVMREIAATERNLDP